MPRRVWLGYSTDDGFPVGFSILIILDFLFIVLGNALGIGIMGFFGAVLTSFSFITVAGKFTGMWVENVEDD